MKLVSSSPVLVNLVVCLFTLVHGNLIATVEYSDGPRVVNDMYFARGRCLYEFDILYPPTDVTVTITFDREISEFDDFGVWDRVDADTTPGTVYASVSKFFYNPGQQVPIDFNMKWDLSQGATPPNGQCETNVGFVVTTTTTPPPPDEAEAVEIAVQALFDDVEALDPSYRRIFQSWP